MAKDIQVSIWGWLGLGFQIPQVGINWGSVGHCMVSDDQGSLVSQFPHPPQPQGISSPHGPNTLYSVKDTMTTEGRPPSVVFDLTIPDDKEADFAQAVALARGVAFWDWDPIPPVQTHCARAAYDVLVAGGINLDPPGAFTPRAGQRKEILPNMVWYLLEAMGAQPTQVTEANLSFQHIQDNTLLVVLARANNLWS